jgi:hypothetical protein
VKSPTTISLCVLLCLLIVSPETHAQVDSLPPLPPPALLSPPDTALALTVRPLLIWSGIDRASRYRLEISLDPAFAPRFLEDSTLTDTLYRVASPLVNDTTYYWRVTAGDSAGWGTCSATGRIATGPLPRISPPLIRFPYTRRGDTTAATARLINLSPRPLNVDSARVSGNFTVADSLPLVVPPGDSILFTVRFTPRSYTLLAETLHVVTDLGDPGLLVRGDSPPPLMSVSADSLLFGPVAVTDTVRRTVTIRNQGYFNDLLVKVCRTSSPAFRLLTKLPIRIPPGESTAVALRFHAQRAFPGRFGTFLDTLHVESNGGAMDIPLRGETPFPEAEPSHYAVPFGDVRYTDSSRTTIRVANRSPNILRIDSVRTTGSAFRASIDRRMLRPGDTAAVTLRFAPWRLGTFSDTLIILTNGRRRDLRIPVSGASPYPGVAAVPARVTFGEVLRTASERIVVGVFNPSINPLSIDSVSTRTRQFRAERWSLSDVVRRGDTLRIAVLFAPDSAGRFFDTLVVASNAAVKLWKVPISGIGIMPDSQAVGPGEFALFQNYPNPFKGTTTFRYALPERCYVRLAVFNSLGQELAVVEDGEADAGYRNVKWISEVASGVYFFKLVAVTVSSPAKQFVGSKRLVIVR